MAMDLALEYFLSVGAALAGAPLIRNEDGSWRGGRLDASAARDFDLLAAGEEGAGG